MPEKDHRTTSLEHFFYFVNVHILEKKQRLLPFELHIRIKLYMLFDLNLMSLRLCLFDSVHSIIIGIKYELSEQLGEQRGYWILLLGFFNKIQFLTIHFMYTNVKN